MNWNRFNSYSATAPSKPRNDIWARGKDWFKQSMITSESNHRVAPREPLYRKCDLNEAALRAAGALAGGGGWGGGGGGGWGGWGGVGGGGVFFWAPFRENFFGGVGGSPPPPRNPSQ